MRGICSIRSWPMDAVPWHRLARSFARCWAEPGDAGRLTDHAERSSSASISSQRIRCLGARDVPRPGFAPHHCNAANDPHLRCRIVRIQTIRKPTDIVVHGVQEGEEMLSLAAALRRFHPGGLLATATDGSREVVTRLPSWSMALVFCSLRIGEIAMAGVCGGRPTLRQHARAPLVVDR